MVTGSDTTSYGYDYEDRLTSVTPPGSSAITYVYNGLGSRVGRGSEEYRRAGASAGSPLLADGSASYTPGLSERRGGQSSFFHWGSFGDPSALSDGSGALSDLYTSDWFLGIVGHTGSSPSPIGAGGGYVDPDTGGINHGGGGEYEPWLGGGPSVAPMILPENGNVNYGIDYGPPLDLLIIVSDFCAAWGDGLTWGGTGIVREGLGVNGIVNQDSAAYTAGDWISIGHGFFLPGPKFAAKAKGLDTQLPFGAVIGETGDRCADAARHYVLDHLDGVQGTFDEMWEANRVWLMKHIENGNPIYDIGYDVDRIGRGPFYAKELALLDELGYTNIVPLPWQGSGGTPRSVWSLDDL